MFNAKQCEILQTILIKFLDKEFDEMDYEEITHWINTLKTLDNLKLSKFDN
jgi:hypothetical protein